MEIVGTPGDDTLVGTAAAETLRGGTGNDILDGLGGNDQLWGGAGADDLRGGDGRDTAVYLTSAAGVTVNLAGSGPQSGADAAGDRLSGVENLTGSRFDDSLTGDAGANLFRGAEGADIIDGGDGRDRASYAYSAEAVDIDLTRTGAQSGGDAVGDVLINIENVTGSDHDDRIVGNDLNNEISGGAGADIIDGGLGSDTVDYRGSTAVDVDLMRATQIGGHAAGDQLANIENLTGSSFADRLLGDGNRNYINGDAGDDYLDGRGGFDDLNGGAGNDTVIAHHGTRAVGGAGTDTLVMHLDDAFAFRGYIVGTDRYSGDYVADNTVWNYQFVRSDGVTAQGFERVEVYGSQWDDQITGTTGADIIYGGGGADYITATQGRDYLDGGEGRDVVALDYGKTTRDLTVDLIQGKAYGYEAIVNFESAVIRTGSGNDHIIGVSGMDPLPGGNTIYAGAGDDVIDLSRSIGFSIVDVGTGNDHFTGGSADDQVVVRGTGYFDGGSSNFDGIDLYLADANGMTLDLAETTGPIVVKNFEYVSIYRADIATGDDVFRMTEGTDYVSSGGGNDHLDGRGGNDTLVGGAGNDWLEGGAGNDILSGHAGDNLMTGGTGADQFHFDYKAHTVVTDFDVAEGDTILWVRPPGQAINFATIMSYITDTEDGALIAMGSDRTLLIEGVAKSDLHADDFV